MKRGYNKKISNLLDKKDMKVISSSLKTTYFRLKAIFLLVIIYSAVTINLSAQSNSNHNHYVSASFSDAFYKYSIDDKFQTLSRPYFGIDVYPLNWLSVGTYLSYKKSDTSFSGVRYKTIGGRIAIHAYPIFDWVHWEFIKDHLDFYVAGLVQKDYIENINYVRYDSVIQEYILLDEPTIYKQKHLYPGYSIGLSYYIFKNIGLNLEYCRISEEMTAWNIFKTGITLRL